MKKISRLAALLAASALLFNFAACSDGGSNGGGGGEEEDVIVTPTTGSWDFTTYSDAAWVSSTATGSTVVADATKTDGTYTLAADASLTSAAVDTGTDGLTLTVLAEKAWDGATKPNYSYQAGTTDGLRIKNPAFKIAGVKGKVKLTVEWSCIAGKAANERSIQLYVGANTTPTAQGIDATTSGASGTNVAMTDFVQTVDCGSGKDLYIGASNNIFIKTVTINNAADAVEGKVTVKFPDFDAGLTDESKITTKEYSIGYAESISADDLTTKLKADTSLSEALTTVISVVQDIINEALVAGGAQSGAVTVTADHIKFLYFGSVEDWTTYDELPDNADAETKAAALAKALTSVEANGTAYITFDITDALGEAVQEAIANASITWNAYDTITLTGTAVTGLSTPNAISYEKSGSGSSATYPRSAATSITSDVYTVLATDESVAGSESAVTLTLKNYTGTGKGTTKVGTSAAMPTIGDTDISKAPTAISYKADSTMGLMIKKDALKFTLQAGTYNVVINFYQKSNTDRNLEVTFGDSGTTETMAAGTTSGTDLVYEKTTVTAESDMNVYIGASNELYIKSIVIKKAVED